MTSVCAWCQAQGIGPPFGPDQTHGICRRHMEETLAELQKMKPGGLITNETLKAGQVLLAKCIESIKKKESDCVRDHQDT